MSFKSSPGPSSVLRGHRADVQALCCHPCRELLYSGDSEGEAKAWDLAAERAIWSHRLHSTQAGVTALHLLFSENCTLLSQGRDGTIKQWALSAEGLPLRNPLQYIETGSYNFCCMAVFLPHAHQSQTQCHQAASATSNTSTDHIIEPQQGQVNHSIKVEHPQSAHNRERHSHPNSTTTEFYEHKCQEVMVAIAGHDPAVLEIWNMQTGTIAQQLMQPEGVKHGMCMAVQLYTQSSKPGLHALVGYEDGTAAVWDASNGKMLASKRLHVEPIMAAAVTPDGSGGICAAADNKVQCFSLDPVKGLLAVHATLEVKQQGIADICIRQDQRLVATAGWDGKVRVFHHKKFKPLAILQYHRKGLTALRFHPQDQRLISASRDGTIAIWSVFQSETW